MTFRKVVFREGTKYLFLALILIGSSLGSLGCGSNLTPDEAGSIASEVKYNDGSGLSSSLDQFDVFVDRTLSMKPFIGERESSYSRMIRVLDNVFATRSSFHGFGYRTQESGQVVDPISAVRLQNPSNYQWVNNDYADLFSSFDSVGDTSRLVISDGVQSDVDGGDRFRRIVKSIGNWVNEGGVFGILAYRAPYQGTYYHEAPEKGQIEYDCPDRPFYVFGFFPSLNAFDDLSSVLEDEGFLPTHQVLIGGVGARVSPHQQALPTGQDQRGNRLLNGLESYEEEIYYGRPLVDEGNAEVRFDATFDLQNLPWSGLSDQELERIVTTMEPSVRSWAVNSVQDDTASTQPLGSRRFSSSESEVRILSKSDSVWTAGIQVPLSEGPPGGESQLMASVLSMHPSPTGANRLIPSELSTRRDDRASACSRTLNLRPMLGAVLRQHYVIGRTMLITDWR
jgi:hypothetical protein